MFLCAARSLATFDETMAALSAWCEGEEGDEEEEEEEGEGEGGGGRRGRGTLIMPRVSEIVAAKHGRSWARAKVTRQVSER